METETNSPNSAQAELWNGRGGEIWTRLQSRLDRLFEPLTAALLSAAAPKSGESIVEIGCGCGDLTLSLAQACGGRGHILGIDISTRMLERAKSREIEARAMADMAFIHWLHADAMLHRFEPYTADLVISRFGVMFFADPVRAFSNIRKALKPGGRLALLCWGALEENPWITLPLAAVHDLIEPKPPIPAGASFSPGPFAFADAQTVLPILSEAGFSNVSAQMVECPVILGQALEEAADPAKSAIAEAMELALESGPLAALLRDADEAMREKVREKIAKALQSCVNLERRHIALTAKCRLYQASSI